MKKNSTQLLIVSLLVATISLGVYYVAFSYIQTINAKADTVKNDLGGSQIKALRLESLRRVALSGGNELEKIQQYIISPGKEVDIVQELEKLSTLSSLTYSTNLIEVKEYAPLTNQNKELLHVVISTQGEWRNTRRFLSLIENLPYNVKIDSVDMIMIGAGTDGKGPEWKSKFDISLVKKKNEK